jgi:hypothetical protein
VSTEVPFVAGIDGRRFFAELMISVSRNHRDHAVSAVMSIPHLTMTVSTPSVLHNWEETHRKSPSQRRQVTRRDCRRSD